MDGSEDTPILAFGSTSNVLPEMLEVLISSEMDLIIGTSGEVVTEVVVGTIEYVKKGVESGIKIRG